MNFCKCGHIFESTYELFECVVFVNRTIFCVLLFSPSSGLAQNCILDVNALS